MDDNCWSELPSDLVENIASRLNVYVDYVRVRAVCKNWRSSLPPKPQYLLNQFPWLMLSPDSELVPYGEHHGFYNLLEDKVYRLNMRPTDRPWKRCCGSSHGWLVLLEERGPAIILFNPITRVEIHLPPITTFPNVLEFDINKVGEEYLLWIPPFFHSDRCNGMTIRCGIDYIREKFIKKVVLSTSPTSLNKEYVAVAIIDTKNELAFCKKGDEGWTIIEHSKFYSDVIYYESVFYAVNFNRSFASFDVTDPSPLMKVIELPSLVRCHDHAEELYLVDAYGKLLMVRRLFRCVGDIDYRYDTFGFEVVRLNSKRTKWVKVENLGDRMLFLGTSSSQCLLATEFSGCDGNCIYFTGETNQFVYSNSCCNHDSGVFSLEDGSTKALPNCTSNRKTISPPPVWLTPNPC